MRYFFLFINWFLLIVFKYRYFINIFIAVFFIIHNLSASFDSVFFIDSPNNSQNVNYLPYNPGIVEINQGFYVELDPNNSNPNYVETSQGYRVEIDGNSVSHESTRRVPRIGNPSHFRPEHLPVRDFHPVVPNETESQVTDVVTSDQSTNHIGIVEPTQSQMNGNGVYWGNQPNRPEIHIPTFCERMKNKVKNTYKVLDESYKKLDEKYERSMLEYWEKERLGYQLGMKREIRKHGGLTQSYLDFLHKRGYIVKNGKVIRVNKGPLLY